MTHTSSTPSETTKYDDSFESPFENAELKELAQANRQHWEGYVILFDIKDSTNRKSELEGRWSLQTTTIYNAFCRLVKKIYEETLLSGKRFTITSFPYDESDKKTPDDLTPITKPVGDACLAFFPIINQAQAMIDMRGDQKENLDMIVGRDIFGKALSFLEKIHNEHQLQGLKLKSVVARVQNVQIASFDNIRDVIGRGLDFVFRLEAYGEPTHIVINQTLKQHLKTEPHKQMPQYDCLKTHILIPCQKIMKGWNTPGGEPFFIVTNLDKLKSSMMPSPSPYQKDVQIELFKFLLANYTAQTASTANEHNEPSNTPPESDSRRK